MTQNWIRYCKVTVGDISLDLSDMQVRFEVHQDTLQSPNVADIWIYNLSESLAQQMKASEKAVVTLDAGYQENHGEIFRGTLIQAIKGKENATDTFVWLHCGDGDRGYNWAHTNTTLDAGCTPKDIVQACLKPMKKFGIEEGFIDPNFGGGLKYPTPVPLFGMSRDILRMITRSFQSTWSMQHQQLDIVADSGTKPGAAVVLNSQTGLIGIPFETEDGVNVRCLINPNIRVNTILQIDQGSINRAALQYGNPAGVSPDSQRLLGITGAADGSYRVLSVDYSGIMRGQPWYSDVVAIGAVTGAPSDNQIALGRG